MNTSPSPRLRGRDERSSLLEGIGGLWSPTRSIIEALDVSKDITSGLLTCCIMLVMDELGLERVKEALHRSVVVAIGPAAHRGPQAGGLHQPAILRRGILNATMYSGRRGMRYMTSCERPFGGRRWVAIISLNFSFNLI